MTPYPPFTNPRWDATSDLDLADPAADPVQAIANWLVKLECETGWRPATVAMHPSLARLTVDRPKVRDVAQFYRSLGPPDVPSVDVMIRHMPGDVLLALLKVGRIVLDNLQFSRTVVGDFGNTEGSRCRAVLTFTRARP